ncbi:MAG: two-component sensor histidine kinase, partial [Alphaproteobacteria bacterium PA3]
AIDAALLLLNERATDLQADIRVISEIEGQKVMAYQGAVEQVIVNLVQNALDAGGLNTKIDIHIISNNKWHEISVRDYGPGLSPKAQGELFQPFSTSKQSGLGLGLVSSRDLVAEFGGELSGGNCDPGCKFVVRLPLTSGVVYP